MVHFEESFRSLEPPRPSKPPVGHPGPLRSDRNSYSQVQIGSNPSDSSKLDFCSTLAEVKMMYLKTEEGFGHQTSDTSTRHHGGQFRKHRSPQISSLHAQNSTSVAARVQLISLQRNSIEKCTMTRSARFWALIRF